MGTSQAYAAADLGVDGGRVVLGQLEHGRLSLREVHRFANRPVRVDDTRRWDIQRLYGEVLAGLQAAGRACPALTSVAVDGWGADFGLLDARGKLLGLPYHHADRRTAANPARLHARVAEAELWSATGVQSRPANTLHQLHAMAVRRSSTLSRAARLLLLPDLLAYWLSGVALAEHTLAATTQCYDLERRAWIAPLLQRARIPTHVFPPVVAPATLLGPVLAAAARRAGIAGVQVVAPAGHDVASTVAALPAETSSFAWVAAGRSSVVGAVTARPLKGEAAFRLGFSHGAGAGGDLACVQREMAGLGLLQECRRAWTRAGLAFDDEAVLRLASAGRPLRAAFDPDDPALRGAADVPEAIRDCCARAGQEVPATPAELTRTILESLAWRYRRTVRELEALLGRRLEVVHLVGAGARSPLLCQLTADACARPVLAGPVDAAAVGNVLAQAVAAGACSWAEARRVVRASLPPRVYEPRGAAAWEEAAGRLEPGHDGASPA